MFWSRSHWGTTEELFPALWGMYLHPMETVPVADPWQLLSTFYLTLTDTTGAADPCGKEVDLTPFLEGVDASDWHQLATGLVRNEGITLSDKTTKLIGKVIAEVLRVSMPFHVDRSYELPEDRLVLLDTTLKTAGLVLKDTASAAAPLQFDVSMTLQDALRAADLTLPEFLFILHLARRVFALTARSRPRQA